MLLTLRHKKLLLILKMVNEDGGLPNFSNSVDFVRPTKHEKDIEHSHRVCKFIGAPNATNFLEQKFSHNCPDACRYVQNKLAHVSRCSKPNHTHVFKILRTFITQPKLTISNSVIIIQLKQILTRPGYKVPDDFSVTLT